MRKRDLVATLASSVCIVAMAAPAQAQSQAFNIPSGKLKAAIDAYARQTGRQIIYKADEIAKAHSRGVRGNVSADEALARLLQGTGFSYRVDSSGAVAIVTGEAAAGSAAADDESADIVVTGSHIANTKSISPVITVSKKEIEESGYTTVGQVISALPQSYSGGQNPGVTNFSSNIMNANTSNASTANLRGLGSDSTLTLLNGHRLVYDGPDQSSDLSGIPLSAISRIEVLADGASATDAAAQ